MYVSEIPHSLGFFFTAASRKEQGIWRKNVLSLRPTPASSDFFYLIYRTERIK